MEGISIELEQGEDNLIGVTVTDENGYYEFSNLNPGDYSILVDDNYMVLTGDTKLLSYDGSSLIVNNMVIKPSGLNPAILNLLLNE